MGRVSKDIIAWRAALRDSDGPRTFTLHLNQQARMWVDGECVCGCRSVHEAHEEEATNTGQLSLVVLNVCTTMKAQCRRRAMLCMGVLQHL
jgi:hypothetical protein